jgi:hypothetical protein
VRTTLLALLTLVAPASAADPAQPRNVLLFVADGLRPGTLTDQTAPAMTALMKRGVTFTNTHALFPTVTMTNAAAMATGHLPGDTGAFADTIHTGFPVAAAGDSPVPLLESGAVLAEVDAGFAGNHLNETTILRAAAEAGLSTAAIGRLGPALLFDHTEQSGRATVIVDEQTGRPGGVPLAAEVLGALRALALPAQAPGQAAAAQQAWFADVAAKAVLPLLRDRGKPFLMVFWSRAPDGTQQAQADSPGRLVPGINGPASLAAIRNTDDTLARLLAALRALGLEASTDVIVASDHGASTISKESATSWAARQSYKDVPAGLLPPGFVAIDLAHGLGAKLFDPDAQGAPVEPGRRPVRGNGLIGESANRPDIVVAANGGADLIYLPGRDKALAARIVRLLAEQDYVSGLFVDSRLGPLPGTLPLSAIGLEGSALPPVPAIAVNFRSFSTGCADPTACGAVVADTVLPQGQGTSGSFSRAETRNVVGAAGPGFRAGYVDPAPVGTADIGRTIAAILGLKLPDKGKLTGRVLTEALLNGAAAWPHRLEQRSAPDEAGRVTVLKYQTVGSARYFDAAGYPGRTLGLE